MIPTIIAISECFLTNSFNPITSISQFIFIKYLIYFLISQFFINPYYILAFYFILVKPISKNLFQSHSFHTNQLTNILNYIDIYITHLHNIPPSYPLQLYIQEISILQYHLNLLSASNFSINNIHHIITSQQRILYLHNLLQLPETTEPFFQEISNNFPILNNIFIL